VHLLKGESATLSKHEIQYIMVNKANCAMTNDECWVTY
jgi:hypothetical protein